MGRVSFFCYIIKLVVHRRLCRYFASTAGNLSRRFATLRLGGGRPLFVRLRLPPLPKRESLPQRGKRERLILLRNRLLKIFIFYFLDKTAYIIKAVNKQNKLAFPCGESGICERSEQMTREVFRRRGEVVAKRRERS